ncbi:MAG: DUF3106 domain-containing protein [Rubrivivax sp.]|nr:DUF3106 domain-containing protein [Rubrivivax sp.]
MLLVLGGICAAGATAAQSAQAAVPAWSSLTPAQQAALAPLKPTWDSNDAPRKKKWVEVAERFPTMPAEERLRVQERMAAWAAMSPTERARARVQFQETRRIGAEERQARWQAYQSLSEEERKRLAQTAKAAQVAQNRAAPAGRPPGAQASPVAAKPVATPPRADAKRNVVAATPGPAPRSVAPTVVQAKPGATTTTVAMQAKPPLHHQPGLPKIVATPAFVDPTTLLPRRGPQAAAMRTAASTDPTQQP